MIVVNKPFSKMNEMGSVEEEMNGSRLLKTGTFLTSKALLTLDSFFQIIGVMTDCDVSTSKNFTLLSA